jgi:hypothetical protein
MTEAAEDIDVSELEEIERIAVELATLAGAEIQAALGSMIAVRYKGESPEKTLWRDPVSEIDQRVETLIRGRVAERFPGHDVIGEEMVERPGRAHDCVWIVDPIDGTTKSTAFRCSRLRLAYCGADGPLCGPCGARPVTRCGRASIMPARAASFALKTAM